MTRCSTTEAEQLARGVLNRISGDCSVRIAHAQITSLPPGGSAQLNVESTLSLAVSHTPELIMCASRYIVTAAPADLDAGREVENHWTVEIELQGTWRREDATAGLALEAAQAFALGVGAMTLHPYARAFVQSAVTDCGYPPYTFDVMPSLLTADDEDGLVDLGRVARMPI